jgi:hypothetical protein
MRHTRDARRARAESLLIARIKSATRTLIWGCEKRAMQRRFIGKPSIGNPKRVPKQQGPWVFLRARPDGRSQFPRTKARGTNHHRINRLVCLPGHLGNRPSRASPIIEQHNRRARQVEISGCLAHRDGQRPPKCVIRRYHTDLLRACGHGRTHHAAHLLFGRDAKRPNARPGLGRIIGEGQHWQARSLGNRCRAGGLRPGQRTNHADSPKADSTPRRIPRAHGITTRIQRDEFNPTVILFKQRQFRRLLQRLAELFLLPRQRQQQCYPCARHISRRATWRGANHDGGLRGTGRKRDKQPKRSKGDQA